MTLENRIRKALEIAIAKGLKNNKIKTDLEIVKNTPWNVSNRMTRSGGIAKAKINKDGILFDFKMSFSKPILENASEEELYNTVTHELAHIIDYSKRNDSNHDTKWQLISLALGGKANRCHKMVVAPRKKRLIKKDKIWDLSLNQMTRFLNINRIETKGMRDNDVFTHQMKLATIIHKLSNEEFKEKAIAYRGI